MTWDEIKTAYQVVTLYERVKKMRSDIIVKLIIAALMGGVASGGAVYTQGGDTKTSLSAALAGALAAAFGYIKQSPLGTPPPPTA